MKQKKLILHIITTLSSGGAEAMLYKLLSRKTPGDLFRHGVISLSGPGVYGPKLAFKGIPVYSLNLKKNPGDIFKIIKLFIQIRRLRPHIIQTWLYHADLVGLMAGGFSGAKIAWNVRCSDMDLEKYSVGTRLVFALLKRLSPMPAAVMVNSQAGKSFHENAGYRPKRWKIIPNGFDTDLFRPDQAERERKRKELGLDDSTPLVGMVARFDPMKGHEIFFRAAQLLREQLPGATFLLVGRGMDGENRLLGDLLERHNLKKRALLFGERKDVHKILPALDICALSSSFGEGFPNVLGEAMCCGVPCVATDVGDASFLMGETGKVVPKGDPLALAGAWLDILSLPRERRMRLGLTGRSRIRDLFGISSVIGEYESFYKELL